MKRLQRGECLEGRYRIEALIASGGQAHVYRGTHIGLERAVAIKLLRNHGTEEVKERMARRFEQEARLISRLKDPHTITLYDFGKLPDGALFMVFEYVDGISLKELIASQGKVEPYRVAKILRQTLSSLHEAHALGVLHRDLKPANIMIYDHVGRTDQVKLLDFGIAKILRGEMNLEALEGLTGNNLVGTPRYIAPEVYQSSDQLGAPSDIYSLGLVAYELLMGEPAVKGNSAIDIFRQQFTTQSICLPDECDIPDGLRKVIGKMIERGLQERYESCEHVLWDLRGWQQSELEERVRSDAFDPQDVEIFDPYDVAPTQAISGDILQQIPVSYMEDSPLHDDHVMSDSFSDIGDSSEYLRPSYPPPRHTPSQGLQVHQELQFSLVESDDETMDEFNPLDLPTQVSADVFETIRQPTFHSDANTEVLPGIIPAELFLQELKETPDLIATSPAEQSLEEETDHTSEISLNEQLQHDQEHAQERKIRSSSMFLPRYPIIGEEEEDDMTETTRKSSASTRLPDYKRRTPPRKKGND